MDPLATEVFVGVLSGAGGNFITAISSSARTWITDLVTGQSHEVRLKTHKDMRNFIIRLAKRVETLEKEIPAEKSEIFKNALHHPSTALLIKKAVVNSAITDDSDKHELLAELIVQRLTANADDMIALAGTAACDAVISLTSKQIKILSIISMLRVVRPPALQNTLNEDQIISQISGWWKSNFQILIENCGIVTHLDADHLMAMGCARIIDLAQYDLHNVVSSEFLKNEIKIPENTFDGMPWFDALKPQWAIINNLIPTSTGRLIGILHKDAILNTKTKINW